ncbi:hypothetical protein Trco_000845 [Trichoderma cornu-damae]|uniref:Transcription factor domain-containing protein n=1 Tax=Trichoderma cornu-damae TaxID=654480 RepID=A0A9P8QSR1_9HYPO|nr:hypothetical protein Trco_000845 [Trichoderma cornu-damae]
MDQELSLFADAEQTLSASDLERPLPDPNLPWDARGILQTSKFLLETQRLLRAWHNLAVEACNDNNAHARDAALGLILYHFICLNLTASFADIERLASRESLGASSWQQSLQTERCIRSRQETIFHSGQALRYLRAVNADARPWWWPTAVHRAILTLWAASTLGLSPWRQGSVDTQPGASMPASELSVVAIDNTAPENPAFGDANWSEKHMLVLARQDEGAVALSDAMGILQYGISLINSFPGSVEGEAVVAKLKALGQVWKGSNGSHVYL